MRNTERGLHWGWLGLVCETIKLGPETINYAQKKKLLNFFMATNPQFILPLRQQTS